MTLINGATEKYGIIGNPVAHSFSPSMQTKAFQALGINAVYLPFLAQADQLGELLQAFQLIGLKGFNVTVPFKEAILPHLDELSPEAQALGSVNTVTLQEGKWIGYSTDGAGFVRGLAELDFTPKKAEICLLGAGGSAKAIAWALAQAGAAHLTLLNRSPEKAVALQNLLRQAFPPLSLSTKNQGQDFDLLINATSLGMKDGCPADNKLIAQAKRVSDIIYNPPQTELLRRARKLDKATQNGAAMLLYQGAIAFEIWTKQPAPVTVMQNSLAESLQTLRS